MGQPSFPSNGPGAGLQFVTEPVRKPSLRRMKVNPNGQCQRRAVKLTSLERNGPRQLDKSLAVCKDKEARKCMKMST
jgi:hypothetical protein